MIREILCMRQRMLADRIALLIISAFSMSTLLITLCSAQEYPDIRTVAADLKTPSMDLTQSPSAGLRVRRVLPGRANDHVYHALYLPRDWSLEKRWPIIVEYTGNGGYRDATGDECNGRPEGGCLGYGITGGEGYVWISLPYLKADGAELALTWWGDSPAYDPRPTIDYLHEALDETVNQFGGDKSRVVLCGFSRGAIACNFLGLNDDKTAELWKAFIVYSHYDGVRRWPYPDSDPDSAALRLKRLKDRPQFIVGEKDQVTNTKRYLEPLAINANLTFAATGFRNHSDQWLLRPSPARESVRAWLRKVME